MKIPTNRGTYAPQELIDSLVTYGECHENSDYPVTIATNVVDW